MKRLLGIAMLCACGSVDIRPEALPCSIEEQAGEAIVEVVKDGADVLVSRTPLNVGDGDEFVPELSFEGKSIFVVERWSEDDKSESSACKSATIRLLNPPNREFIVEWYLGESVVPDTRIRFNPKDL